MKPQDLNNYTLKILEKAHNRKNPSRAARFIRREVMDIHYGGMRVLLKKAITFLFSVVPAILSIPLVLLLRALRPFVLIRFGRFRSSRIGHFSADPELYLCERDMGMYPRRAFDIFYYCPHVPICNQQLKKMWNRVLRVSFIAYILDMANRWLPGYEVHTIPAHVEWNVHNVIGRTKAHLSFTAEEERVGSDGLRKLGIPEGASFVCLHVRDSSYLDTIYSGHSWKYHDFRDSDIQSYLAAAKELTDKGYYVVRMGAVVKEALKTANPKIIDYATSGSRSDFLDIFLCAKCRFFLGTSAGLASVPRIFRVPVACANLLPMNSLLTYTPNALAIPKKLWLRKENRFLTFREIFALGIHEFEHAPEYEEKGIYIVDNTAEEIVSLVLEMEARLKGVWQTTEESESLQREFWSFFRVNKICRFSGRVPGVRIGAEFLRQNRQLLKQEKNGVSLYG